jgi:hypothetical protein
VKVIPFSMIKKATKRIAGSELFTEVDLLKDSFDHVFLVQIPGSIDPALPGSSQGLMNPF